MEESERTESELSEMIEIQDFSNELKDTPHVVEYIQKLHEQARLQRNHLSELKNKLVEYEKQHGLSQKLLVDGETQTDNGIDPENPSIPRDQWIANEEERNTVNIVEEVTEAAELALNQTNFVFEKTTGLYYDFASGYYYDANARLYYNGHTGTYYYFDEESKSYKFHSQVDTGNGLKYDSEKKIPEEEHENESEEKKKKVKLVQKDEEANENIELEEGECSDSDDQESLEENTSTFFKEDETILEKMYPPCMRIIVKETNISSIKVGSLFIITCTCEGSIGREGSHSIIIPDINISKHHAKLTYNKDRKCYEIIDLGSRNGTLLNGKRLSAAKQESEPTEIIHGSILQFGSTKLLCHIHDGHETCGLCEPGLIASSESFSEENVASTKNQYQSELKRLKSKFGLKQSGIESACRVAPGYHDRAQSRRELMGSSSQYEKTQQSSLNESIPKDNMGFKLLSKMGWSEGKSLGKNGHGLVEPIIPTATTNQAGFGTSENYIKPIEIHPSLEKKQSIWRKTQQRFKETHE